MVGRDVLDAGAGGSEVVDEVFAYEFHHFPDGFSWLVDFAGCETSQQGHVDGRVELADDIALHAEPFGSVVGAAAVEPLGRFEPLAKGFGIFVEAVVLQDEREGTGRRGVSGKLVVVEVSQLRLMVVAHVDDGGTRVGDVFRGWFASLDCDGALCE